MSQEETPKHLRKQKEEAEQHARYYQESLTVLTAQPEFVEYAQQFRPDSVDEFIKDYATKRAMWLQHGPFYLKRQDDESLLWVYEGLARLEEIQQKKLFDLQCLWRAEKIELPGVRTTADFSFWEYHILQCPFLEPVTEEEVDLYILYLSSNNFEREQSMFDRWQDYEGIKLAYASDNENRNFPEWYDFYNGRKGTGIYMTLPDIRGEKEMFYRKLSARKEQQEYAARPKTVSEPTETRPRLYLNRDSTLSWFVETFEDSETKQAFKDCGGERVWKRPDIDIWPLVRSLSHDAEVWPMSGWFDFREALLRCHNSYCIHKIAQAMPEVFEEYCLQIDTGLGFANENPDFGKDVIAIVEQQILEGRVLNGEPADFDF